MLLFGIKSSEAANHINSKVGQEKILNSEDDRETFEKVGASFFGENHPKVCFRFQIEVFSQELIHPPWAFGGFLAFADGNFAWERTEEWGLS